MNPPQALASIRRQREFLKRELDHVRQASLLASDKGDFRKVAQLTFEAARLNQALASSDAQEGSL